MKNLFSLEMNTPWQEKEARFVSMYPSRQDFKIFRSSKILFLSLSRFKEKLFFYCELNESEILEREKLRHYPLKIAFFFARQNCYFWGGRIFLHMQHLLKTRHAQFNTFLHSIQGVLTDQRFK